MIYSRNYIRVNILALDEIDFSETALNFRFHLNETRIYKHDEEASKKQEEKKNSESFKFDTMLIRFSFKMGFLHIFCAS